MYIHVTVSFKPTEVKNKNDGFLYQSYLAFAGEPTRLEQSRFRREFEAALTQRADESSRTREGFQPAPPPPLANNNSYSREGFQPAPPPPPANSLVGQQLSGIDQSTGQEQQLFAGVQAANTAMAVGAAGDPGLFSTQAAATAAPSLQPGYA
jgi:hypothetical protein